MEGLRLTRADTRTLFLWFLAAGATIDETAAVLDMNRRAAHRLADRRGILRKAAAIREVIDAGTDTEQINERAQALFDEDADHTMARLLATGRFAAEDAGWRLAQVKAAVQLASERAEPSGP
ncbi:hypothetical protein DFP74_5781 [Nocardiopsis sp. Huas11]|uniref:hypothetical protein n=1 Tax=Nocardiopsis sp. Huas11 TaxID=2183912 RepID=UPI000EAF8450|nr:hypothetical protein [Nocardiopsis sp. Huas11]RKS10035.1 hypothetical protein DFP74_5781 [Nocardiopsis sp. Huas11]